VTKVNTILPPLDDDYELTANMSESEYRNYVNQQYASVKKEAYKKEKQKRAEKILTCNKAFEELYRSI